MSALAHELDKADGVIDGKFYGRPIVEVPAGTRSCSPVGTRTYGSTYRPATTRSYYAADGVIDGAYHGRSIIEIAPRVSRVSYQPSHYRGSTAYALDAADGVIDGAYHGRPIVETPTIVHRPATSPYPYHRSTALALDAADGVIDGAYYGRPIIETAPQVSRVSYQPSHYRSSTAYELDAADGVIDGAYHGRPIIETAPRVYGSNYRRSYGASYPSTYYGRHIIDQPGTRVIRSGYDSYYGASGLHGRRVVSSHAPARVYSGYGGGYFRSTTANSLDAADGVIDGKFHGRQIVEEGAEPKHKSDDANALDAAEDRTATA